MILHLGNNIVAESEMLVAEKDNWGVDA